MNSLRTQLATHTALGLLAMLALASLLAHRSGSLALEEQFDQTLESRLTLYQSLVEQEGLYLQVEPASARALITSAHPHAEDGQILAPDGTPLFLSEGLEAPHPVTDERLLGIRDTELADGRPGRVLTRVVPALNVESGGMVHIENPTPAQLSIRIARSRETLDVAQAALARNLALIAALLILGGGIIAAFVVRRGLSPLIHFSKRVGQLDVATISEPFSAGPHPSELRPVAVALDDLRERVDQALRREKRFAATIAHEIRTPFSEVRALSEVALGDLDDRQFTREAFRDIHRISIHMQSLLNVIRLLTEAEHRSGDLPNESVDVGELLDKVLDPLAGDIQDKGLVISRGAARRTKVSVNRAALTSICRNLMTNAIEYCTGAGQVSLEEEHVQGALILRFQNPCEDLSSESLKCLTQPFWRGQASDPDSPHVGLGLNIAQGMAQLAGLRLSFAIMENIFTAEVLIPRRA